jgi:hypothetical protein
MVALSNKLKVEGIDPQKQIPDNLNLSFDGKNIINNEAIK